MAQFKFFLFTTFIMLVSLSAEAQKGDNPYKGVPFKERIFLGGDFGAAFGTDITFVRIAPLLGYNVSPKFSVGAGPSYQYWRDRTSTPNLESTIWGGSTFGRFFVLDEVFLQSQFEILNLDEIAFGIGSDFGDRERVTIPVLFIGGGYSQRTSNGSGFFLAVMYDVIGDRNSPYPNDIVFRLGGFIGF